MPLELNNFIDQVARRWRADGSITPQERATITQQIASWNRVVKKRIFWDEDLTTLELIPNVDGDLELGNQVDAIKHIRDEKYDTSDTPFVDLKYQYVTSNKVRVFQKDDSSLAFSVNEASDELTTTEDHGFGTGDKVRVHIGNQSGNALPGGLSLYTDYYVIKVSDTVFQLATTEANATAGTQIDITSTGSGNRFVASTNKILYTTVRRKAPVDLPQPTSAPANDLIMTDYNGYRLSAQTQDEIQDFAIDFIRFNVVADMHDIDKQPLIARQFRGQAEVMLVEEIDTRERQDSNRTGRPKIRMQKRRM